MEVYDMKVSKDIVYVGVNDSEIKLFEGQFPVENGMAYNSYVILDDKVAVMDSVGESFDCEWLNNIEKVLNGRKPDYLIVQHMEPDHSTNIITFANKYKDAIIVSNPKSFVMMKNFFGEDFSSRKLAVNEGDTLCLGKHTLTFINAPMVHWPEVIVTYDNYDKVLFSADGFGKFGTYDFEENWEEEASRYYFGIVGKFGVQVQALLKKASALDIKTICPLHGPVLSGDISKYINFYNTWSSYTPEKKGVCIAYTTVYGHTKVAVEKLAEKLKEKGVEVFSIDVGREDITEAIEKAFVYDKLVLATTTYNGGIFPFMKTFINKLLDRNYKNRTIGFIENGCWAPFAIKGMKAMLEGLKDITYTQNNVTILSAVSEKNLAEIENLANELK